MAGHIHAIILLACPIVTVLLLWRAKRRRPARQTLLLSILLSLVVMFLASGMSFHMCNAGRAEMQWLVPGACLYFLVAYLANAKVRWLAAIGMVVALIGLQGSYENLVHESGWTGNPEDRTIARLYASQAEGVLRDLSEKARYRGAAFGAGWLRELPIWPALKENAIEWPLGDEFDRPKRQVAISQWHSFYSHLYRAEKTPVDYWYCGGPIDKGKVELRTHDAIDSEATTQPVESGGG